MTVLRRYSAFVAALVLATVAVQMLDMGLCCEQQRSEPTRAEANVLLISEGRTSGDLLVSGRENGRHAHRTGQPDCLCHLVFVVTGTPPVLLAAIILISAVAETQESLHSILLSPPGHIPLT